MNLLSELFSTLNQSIGSTFIAFLPRLISGILILIIGVVLASLLRDVIKIAYRYFRIGRWLELAGISKDSQILVWPSILGEIVRWFVIFLFLMSAVEVWGIPKVADVLGEMFVFFPSVLVAVIIGWIGLVASRLLHSVVIQALSGFGKREASFLANVARITVLFFTVLIILTQLGVAADLIRILFTGIVAMLALSLGLAFGLGGQEEAKRLLKKLRDTWEAGDTSVKKPRK